MVEKHIQRKLNSDTFKEYFENIKNEIGDKKVLIYGLTKELKFLDKKGLLSGLNIIAACDEKFPKNILPNIKKIKPEKIKELNAEVILVFTANYKTINKYIKTELNIGENIRIENVLKELFDQESKFLPYLEKIRFEKHIKHLAKKLKNKKIIIYGASVLFETIKAYYDLSQLNIIGISDMKFQNSDVQDFLGYKAIKPADIISNNPDYVLISTVYFQQILQNLQYRLLDDTNIKVKPLIEEPIVKNFNFIKPFGKSKVKNVYAHIEDLKKKEAKINKYKRMILPQSEREIYFQNNPALPGSVILKNSIEKISKICDYANITHDEFWQIVSRWNDFTKEFLNFEDGQDFYKSWKIHDLCLNVYFQLTSYQELYSYIFEHFKNRNMRYCDFGCGSATMSLFLAENASFEYTHLYDVENASSEYIRYYIKNNNLKNVEWKNVENDIKNEEYDLILCNDVLEHLENSSSVLKKIHGALRDKGYLILQAPFEISNIPEHIEEAAEDFYFNGGYNFLKDNFEKVYQLNPYIHISGVYKKKR